MLSLRFVAGLLQPRPPSVSSASSKQRKSFPGTPHQVSSIWDILVRGFLFQVCSTFEKKYEHLPWCLMFLDFRVIMNIFEKQEKSYNVFGVYTNFLMVTLGLASFLATPYHWRELVKGFDLLNSFVEARNFVFYCLNNKSAEPRVSKNFRISLKITRAKIATHSL